MNRLTNKYHPHSPFLSWKCDVCKLERLDKFISVKSHDLGLKPEGTAMRNVKYCNDNEHCINEALNHYLWMLKGEK